MPGHRTPIHDHTVWGLVGVMRGEELCEEYSNSIEARAMHHGRPGEVDRVSPRIGDIHVVSNAGAETAVSIHVYGAKSARCGAIPSTRQPARRRNSSPATQHHHPELWDRSSEARP